MSSSSQPWGGLGSPPPPSLNPPLCLRSGLLPFICIEGKKRGKTSKGRGHFCIFPRRLCDPPSTFEPGCFKVVSHGWGHLSQPQDQQRGECQSPPAASGRFTTAAAASTGSWNATFMLLTLKRLRWVVAVMASRQSRWTKAEKNPRNSLPGHYPPDGKILWKVRGHRRG